MKIDLACGLVVCTRGDDRFKVGMCYPMMGYNNGSHIAYTDTAGNMVDYIVHNYGDELINPDDMCESTYPIFKYFMNGDEMIMKRGYPNPNYTEADVMEGVELKEIKSELILDEQLVEYIQKAAKFDCLVNAIKAMGKVNDDVVKAITGTIEKEEMVPKKEADSYWGYYKQEQNKTNELKEKVSKLEHARRELIEILRQNNIGEWGNTEEVKNDGENTDHRESDA